MPLLAVVQKFYHSTKCKHKIQISILRLGQLLRQRTAAGNWHVVIGCVSHIQAIVQPYAFTFAMWEKPTVNWIATNLPTPEGWTAWLTDVSPENRIENAGVQVQRLKKTLRSWETVIDEALFDVKRICNVKRITSSVIWSLSDDCPNKHQLSRHLLHTIGHGRLGQNLSSE